MNQCVVVTEMIKQNNRKLTKRLKYYVKQYIIKTIKGLFVDALNKNLF